MNRLKNRDITLEFTDNALAHLASEGYDPAYGARPLKRVIQKQVLDTLSLDLLDGKFADGDTIVVDLSEGKLKLR